MNLQGNIDLMKLEKAGVVTIKGVRCVVIPVDYNDIFISADTETLKPKAAYMSININERREQSKYGSTHYAKQSFSKQYREKNAKAVETKKNIYLGDFKPHEFESINQANVVTAPTVELDNSVDNEDLPF